MSFIPQAVCHPFTLSLREIGRAIASRQSAVPGAKLSSVSNAANETSIDGAQVSAGRPHLTSAEQELIEQLNRGYVCPPDAGPMWRAANDAGVDMSLVEDALRMSPAERLRAHQRALNQILALREARSKVS